MPAFAKSGPDTSFNEHPILVSTRAFEKSVSKLPFRGNRSPDVPLRPKGTHLDTHTHTQGSNITPRSQNSDASIKKQVLPGTLFLAPCCCSNKPTPQAGGNNKNSCFPGFRRQNSGPQPHPTHPPSRLRAWTPPPR